MGEEVGDYNGWGREKRDRQAGRQADRQTDRQTSASGGRAACFYVVGPLFAGDGSIVAPGVADKVP